MRHALLSILFLIGTATTLVSCSGLPDPTFAAERPAGSGTWGGISGRPAWVDAPPARAEHLRFVATGRSNMCSIVLVDQGPRADREAVEFVTTRLIPIVGDDAAGRAAESAKSGLQLLARAHRSEILTRELTPGNTLCTAWALWEVALDDVLSALPEDRRADAREALLAD